MSNQLKLYHRRKEAGLCVACGEFPPVDGTVRCEECRKKRAEISKKQKENRPEGSCRECLTQKARPGKTVCEKCAERGRKKSLNEYRTIRKTILELYGGECKCCGINNPKYLQLDHINNDGGEERKSIPSSIRGGRFYKYVLKQGKRDDLQLLCANCHNAKRYGGCTEDDYPLRKE